MTQRENTELAKGGKRSLPQEMPAGGESEGERERKGGEKTALETQKNEPMNGQKGEEGRRREGPLKMLAEGHI